MLGLRLVCCLFSGCLGLICLIILVDVCWLGVEFDSVAALGLCVLSLLALMLGRFPLVVMLLVLLSDFVVLMLSILKWCAVFCGCCSWCGWLFVWYFA